MNFNYNVTVTGKAKAFVFDCKTQEIVYESDWTKNIITNSGLNRLARMDQTNLGGWPFGTNDINNTFLAYGSGSQPNSYSSTICATPVSASQSGNIITLSQPFFWATSGNVLKYSDGTSTFITSADSTQLISRKSLSKSSQIFDMYITNIDTLYGFISSSDKEYTNTQIGLQDNMTVSANFGYATVTFSRYFPENTGSTQNIYEVGSIIGNVASRTIGSRLTFNQPIQIENGQRLILNYQFRSEIPLLSANQIVNYNITNWSTASGEMGFHEYGTHSATLYSLFGYNGDTSDVGAQVAWPGFPYYVSVYSDNRSFSYTTPPLTGLIFNRISNSHSNNDYLTYVNNSFSSTKYNVFNPLYPSDDFNSTDIGSIVIGATNNNNFHALRINFSQKQSKAANQKLTIYLTKTANRDI